MGDKITLTERIYHELYHDITSQKLCCGQKLTLTELKKRFNVSQTPIREALTRLTESGLVNYCSNSSVTVIKFTESDIRELFQCISEFDALAILFCKNAFSHVPLLYDLQEIVDTGNKLLQEGDIEGWSRYSDLFHLTFYRHAQNHYLDDAARKLRARIDILSAMYYRKDLIYIENINEGHNAILQCVKDNDFNEATAIMRVHLQFNMVYAFNAYKEFEEKQAKGGK